MTRVTMFDMPLDLLDMDQSVARIAEMVEERRPAQHVVLNAGKVVLADRDPVLRTIIQKADLVNADGMSVVWAGRLMGIGVPERVAGIDLMERLLGVAEERAWSVYFLGARQEVLDRFLEVIANRFPRLVVAGSRNGYFDDDRGIAAVIAASGARLLFLGFSSPKKELFVAAQSQTLGPIFTFGVGGSFDVWAGVTRRAPLWMQRAGLEWFFRLVQEPRRMWRRYVLGNMAFAQLAVREAFRTRSGDSARGKDGL